LQQEFHAHTKDCALSNDYLKVRESTNRAVAKYLALCPSDIRDFSVEQLQYIPKVILLRVYGDYIEHVWDKLPEYMKADSEVRTYRRCDEHYNQS